MTEAGADLLEQIEATGSLSEAARRLRFSYRRAWMLLDAMNRRWPRPLVTTAVGGKRGGGASSRRAGGRCCRRIATSRCSSKRCSTTRRDAFRRSVRTRAAIDPLYRAGI